MEILAAIGGASSLSLGVFAWVLWTRGQGLRAESKAAYESQLVAERNLEDVLDDFEEYRKKAEFKESQLIAQLEHYDKHELDAIEEEPDRSARIARRRRWVAGMLSQKTFPARNDGS